MVTLILFFLLQFFCLDSFRISKLSIGKKFCSMSNHPIQKYRDDFPILKKEIYPGKSLIFFDSAASSQKPAVVLESMRNYYENFHSNVHRGAHALANLATEKYEDARKTLSNFINASRSEEIIFTRGATEAINLVALTWGQRLVPGDEIIISVMEHHSNIVPWHILQEKQGIKLKFINITENGELDLHHFRSLLSPRTKLVSIVHSSNVLGVVNPIEEIINEAHKFNSKVLIDACQSLPHIPIDVQSLNVDFLVASSHKMCGPTGIGFLYSKFDILSSMPPLFGGGEMIDTVELTGSTFAEPPARFEAGTPAIAEAVGYSAACNYLSSIGLNNIHDYENELSEYLYVKLSEIEGIKIYGPTPGSRSPRSALVSFNHEKIHPTDLAFFLDQEGVAVRTGHHCAQPLHKILNCSGSLRASLYFYNTKEEIDKFIYILNSTIKLFLSLKY